MPLTSCVARSAHLGAAAAALAISALGHAPSAAQSAGDEDRYALVIGLGAYAQAEPLPNAENDAKLVADTLEAIGFDVAVGLDLGHDDLADAVDAFAAQLPEDAVAMVYFTGHAVHRDGSNYLVAADYDPASPEAALQPIGSLMDGLRDAGAAMRIVVFDSCRESPTLSGAFAPADASETAHCITAEAPQAAGGLVAFSSAPGQAAADGDIGPDGVSPFALSLIESLIEPGLSIEDVFRRARSQVIGKTEHDQIPWSNSSIVGDAYLIEPEMRVADTGPTECDLLAGHPSDPERVHAGVPFSLLRPVLAIPACRAALDDEPDNPRFMTQLARALEAAGDYEEAIALNLRAAELGYVAAYHNLGNIYKKGSGVEQSWAEAHRFFLIAAELGHAEDSYNVGEDYRRGREGVEQNFELALLWLERAAAQDYPSAFDKLGLMSLRGQGVEEDPAQAAAYFLRGATLGDPSAMVNYADSLRLGRGVAQDYAEARRYYLQAARLRRRAAYFNMGRIYQQGLGVEIDLVEAAFWYGLGARANHRDSATRFTTLIDEMDEDQVIEIEERIEEWLSTNFG